MIYFVFDKGNHEHEKRFTFQGTINVTSNVKHKFERQDPFDPSKKFTYGRFYSDTIQITIAFMGQDIFYQELYKKVMQAESYHIEWDIKQECEDGEDVTFFYRRIVTEKIPFPSSLRYLNGEVSFTLETEKYEDNEVAQIFCHSIRRNNLRYNRSTIRMTIWN